MQAERLRTVKHFNNRFPGSAAHLHSDQLNLGKDKDKRELQSLPVKPYRG